MMNMMPEYPCPFCGELDWSTEYQPWPTLKMAIVCKNCGLRAPWAKEHNMAVLSWEALPRETKVIEIRPLQLKEKEGRT